jgi:hypothetical protein
VGSILGLVRGRGGGGGGGNGAVWSGPVGAGPPVVGWMEEEDEMAAGFENFELKKSSSSSAWLVCLAPVGFENICSGQ